MSDGMDDKCSREAGAKQAANKCSLALSDGVFVYLLAQAE